MSVRELVVLGTASQVPTRRRNHNGYLLLWDGEGILFDPGEGSQRQMTLAGVAASALTRICVTHFHGDHSLGLPGVIQRLSLDGVKHPVTAHYPADGAGYFANLRHASSFHETADLREAPVTAEGDLAELRTAAGVVVGTLSARRLRHPVEAYGYRLVEPDRRRMLPGKLAAYGITGPAVRDLQRAGHLEVDGRRVTLAEVSEARAGQRFAFVMDTALCDGVYALADGVDLLVIESTFLAADEALAARFGHLTAAQAGRVARECGVRTLVLTHFSQRYADPRHFADEARQSFAGDLVVAEDLLRVPVPPRCAGPWPPDPPDDRCVGVRTLGRVSVLIRPADPADLATVGVLHTRSTSTAYAGIVPAEALAAVGPAEMGLWWTERWRYERDTHRMLVAEHQDTGELAGFTYVGPSPAPDSGELYAIHVDPDQQGRGIGRALMGAALRGLANLGLSHAVLWVLVGNDAARRFYERGGWRGDPVERESPIGTALTRQIRYSRSVAARAGAGAGAGAEKGRAGVCDRDVCGGTEGHTLPPARPAQEPGRNAWPEAL